jgi:hypothetical protein
MKRQWDIEDLIEHMTLLPTELEPLTHRTGGTCLGFAVPISEVASTGKDDF